MNLNKMRCRSKRMAELQYTKNSTHWVLARARIDTTLISVMNKTIIEYSWRSIAMSNAE